MGEDEPSDSALWQIAKVAFPLGLILCGLLFAYSEMPRSIKREITLQKIMRNLQKYSHSDTIPVVDHNDLSEVKLCSMQNDVTALAVKRLRIDEMFKAMLDSHFQSAPRDAEGSDLVVRLTGRELLDRAKRTNVLDKIDATTARIVDAFDVVAVKATPVDQTCTVTPSEAVVRALHPQKVTEWIFRVEGLAQDFATVRVEAVAQIKHEDELFLVPIDTWDCQVERYRSSRFIAVTFLQANWQWVVGTCIATPLGFFFVHWWNKRKKRKGANVESSASRTARLSDAPALRPARSDSPPPKEAEKPASDEKPKRKLS